MEWKVNSIFHVVHIKSVLFSDHVRSKHVTSAAAEGFFFFFFASVAIEGESDVS